MEYVIGIDGGGTKTEAVLADGAGNILARAIGESSNLNLVSETKLKQVFSSVLGDLAVQAADQFQKVTHLFAGIAGIGNEQAAHRAEKLLEELTHQRVKVQAVPDALNALYSGTIGKPGIVQIAGTGSVTFAITPELEHQRIGGWGYLFGDEGSGYAIGRQAIEGILRAKDGLGQETVLTALLLSRFSAADEIDLIQQIYASPVPKNEISPLSTIVMNAYKAGDSVAAAIIEGAAKEISHNIAVLYERSFAPQKVCSAVLCGGVFNDRQVLPALIKAELQEYRSLSIITPEIRPVEGSVIGAYLLNGATPEELSKRDIVNTLKAGVRQ